MLVGILALPLRLVSRRRRDPNIQRRIDMGFVHSRQFSDANSLLSDRPSCCISAFDGGRRWVDVHSEYLLEITNMVYSSSDAKFTHSLWLRRGKVWCNWPTEHVPCAKCLDRMVRDGDV